ncbi:MAG: MATE family efflux transporter [Treponema sp.]|nr:MATE family efflux transporter [Treponema sp.]
MTTDMTKGSPTKHLLMFALPLLFGNLFQQFYNIFDSIVVGRFVGAESLAAVGACGSLTFLFINLSSGLAVGIGVIVSQYFGAHDDKSVKSTIASSVYILTATSLFVTLIVLIFAPGIMKFLRVPDEIRHLSVSYLRITCGWGIIFMAFYNGTSSILRALGDSKTPLYFLIVSSVINVILDIIFVVKLSLGVTGVALATLISQAASAIGCLIFAIKKNEYFRLNKEELKPNKHIIIMSFKLGVPIALQNSLISISVITLQSTVNSFGPSVMAAYTIAGRVESLVHQPFQSLSNALSTYTGQNVGAHDQERVKKGFRRGVTMAIIFALTMLVVMHTLGQKICLLFVNDPDVIKIGAKALTITSLAYTGLGMIYIPRGLLNGAGDTGFSMINGICEVIVRISGALILTKTALGYWGVWWTNCITWSVTGIVCLIRYWSGVWKKKAVV